jgi:ABC-2 type transport system permease protein
MKILFKMTLLQLKMLLRDKAMILGSLGIAVISMLIFGSLFANDKPQPLSLVIVDQDKSATSAQTIEALKSSDALKITLTSDRDDSLNKLRKGDYSAMVVIQNGFETGLAKASATVQLYVDESNQISAARARGLVNGILDAISKQANNFKPLITVEEQQVTVRQLRNIDFLTPGMLGLTIMFANIYVGVSLINWRERGTLKRMSATPLKAWQLIMSQIISQFVLSILQAALVLLVGFYVFNVQVKMEWIPLILLFAMTGTFSVMALGYVVGNFVKKREAAQNVVSLIALPMMFLGGSYFPVEPDGFLRVLVDILPLTHLNRALREIMLNESSFNQLILNFGVLMAFGVVLLTLSIGTFKWAK